MHIEKLNQMDEYEFRRLYMQEPSPNNDVITEKFQTVQAEFTRQYYQKKEEVLRNVMQQALGREPTNDDAKDFSLIIKEGEPLKEGIRYKNLYLGIITSTFEGYGCTIEFEPNKTL